jgi:hypothetical protein
MKKTLLLITLAVVALSCQENIQTNTPGFQGLKDDVYWRANDARAYIEPNGNLRIEALTEFESLTLNTVSANPGIYYLGSTTTSNSANYFADFDGNELEYETIPALGPAFTLSLIQSGTGYTPDCTQQPTGSLVCNSSHETTGGTGFGLTVSVLTNAAGAVTQFRIASRGNGYTPGDIITVVGGGTNCRFRIINVESSNGEIQITNYDNVNMTVSGKFKFNARRINNNPFIPEVLNYQYGEFYKVPIFPSL